MNTELGFGSEYREEMKTNVDVTYNNMIRRLFREGTYKGDRTGTGTYSLFGHQMRFNLSDGFPILSGKKVAWKMIVSELLWFLKGDTNIKFLLEHKNHIWDEWAFQKYIESEDYVGIDMTNFGLRSQTDEVFAEEYKLVKDGFCQRILTDSEFAEKYGTLGDVYGKQWRSWEGKDGEILDQISNVIEQIKNNPNSRRLIVTAWNPTEIDKMALPPCHCFFQFYVVNGKLSCQLYQRSVDTFLGLPFNIASYALLLHIIADQCDLEVGEFIHTSGDAHIYVNHEEQLKTHLARPIKQMPTLDFPKGKSLEDYKVEDFKLIGYEPHGKLKGAVAV